MTLSALITTLAADRQRPAVSGGFHSEFQQVSVTNEATSLRETMGSVTSRCFDYFNLRFLFISGDPEPRHHTGHGGELYWCLAPLILIGLYVAIRGWRQQASYRIILVGLLVSPASAALTVDREHSTRSVQAVIFWLLLAMLGARWLWRRPGPWRKLLFLTACTGALEIALYMRDYFGAYQTRDPEALQTELTDALEYCFGHLDTNQVLYISASTYTPYGAIVKTDLKPRLYAFVLFFGKIDPRIYQRTGLPTDTVRLYDGHAAGPGLLLRCNNYYIRRPDKASEVLVGSDNLPMPPVAKLIKSIPFSGPYSFAKYQVFAIP